MTAVRGARARARAEITEAIKAEARRQMAEQGAVKLSLRSVAREVGMVSSALYRYFPSRDELLTALIVDAYDSVGAAAEEAYRRCRAASGGPAACWSAVCRAVREWALVHPHEYALIHGSPIPGYEAPQTTVEAASRVGLQLIEVVRLAHAAGELEPPRLPGEARAEAERLAAELAPELPPAAVLALVAAWAQLYGVVGFEVFGQFERVVEERALFFAVCAENLGRSVGLTA